MKKARKTIIFLPDGMADEPLASLGGRTPLQVAKTPGMDALAARGQSGTLLTLPQGFPTSSDVANMSVLGCDLKTEYCGRGVLEAASQGIPLGPNDVAFRCNLVSVDDTGRLVDFSGGHVEQAVAEGLIAELNAALGTDQIRFYPGVSYRNLLVLSGTEFSPNVVCEKPDDNAGNLISEHLPRLQSDDTTGAATLAVLLDLTKRAADVLSMSALNQRAVASGRLPANGIWIWSPGRAGAMRTLSQRHGITSAVISAVDVINGLGRCLGMDVIRVPGATGYIDTNFEGKAQAAIEAIASHDLVYVHVEAVDEVSHAKDLELKIKAIEDFDAKIVSPVMAACGADVTYAVLPDHPVPIAMGKHTRVPVPVAICGPDIEPDSVRVFDELAAPMGSLGALFGPELMAYLFSSDDLKNGSRE